MCKPLIVGITGGIGGGKSTLSEKLRVEGYLVYDTDLRAKALQNENADLILELKRIFGNEIYNSDGLDRATIAKVVFREKALLQELNRVVHPYVRRDFDNWVLLNCSAKLLFVESAIMFESGFVDFVDKVIVMTASEIVRINRVVKRDGVSAEQVKARIANQMPDALKISKADFVVYSDDNSPLIDKMHKILAALTV